MSTYTAKNEADQHSAEDVREDDAVEGYEISIRGRNNESGDKIPIQTDSLAHQNK